MTVDGAVERHGCVHSSSVMKHFVQLDFPDVIEVKQMHDSTLLSGVWTDHQLLGRHYTTVLHKGL